MNYLKIYIGFDRNIHSRKNKTELHNDENLTKIRE